MQGLDWFLGSLRTSADACGLLAQLFLEETADSAAQASAAAHGAGRELAGVLELSADTLQVRRSRRVSSKEVGPVRVSWGNIELGWLSH